MVMNTIGGILLVIGLIVAAWQYKAIHGKEVAEGRVTAIEPYVTGTSGSRRGGTTYRIVANFADRSGGIHTYRADFGVSSPGYSVGDRIRIYFDGNNPADCGVLSFGYRFGVAWGFIVTGLALLFITGGLTAGNRWIEDLIPTTVPASQSANVQGPHP